MTPAFSSKWMRVLVWGAVILTGTTSLAVLSWSRGEPVNALWVVVASLCVFAVSYRFHSAWLMAKVLTLDELRATPAVVHDDGRDFVKTNRWVVFGHHFAAIAGPGPLVGPVLAAQFGYLPGLLWILIGATLGGAVHDSIILFCSTRRRGKSLGQMISEEISPVAGVIALVSILAILMILIAVLGLVVVNALAESPWGLFTIAATMPIAILMGLAMRRVGHGSRTLLWISIAGVLALLGAVYAGHFVHDSSSWSGASILPVWLLLAPRDYLSTFMKIGTVALLALAVVVIAPQLRMPSLTKFIDGSGPVLAGPVFPFCFITIACAAVSGFHSLIASGTTPKMITRESDIRIIGYGAMITEMLVGVMALIAACAMQPGEYFAINIKGEPAAVVAKVSALGFPVTVTQMADLAASVGEQTMVGRPGGAPTFAVGMARMQGGPRLVVSLCDHVRGAVHPDHDRRGYTGGAFPDAGFAGQNLVPARTDPLNDGKLGGQRGVCCRLGMVPVSRRRRSARWHQQPVADLRRGKPAAGGLGARAGHHSTDQDGPRTLHLGFTYSFGLVARSDHDGGLDEDFQRRSSNRIFARGGRSKKEAGGRWRHAD